MSRRQIIITARSPVAGQVKTRLGRQLGGRRAATLARNMLLRTVATASSVPGASVQLHCYPSVVNPLFTKLSRRYGMRLYRQQGSDLGERMFNAFDSALAATSNVLLIGTDCPGFSKELLQAGFRALEAGNDAVIAPAADGGYVLLGLKQNSRLLFEDMQWGTDQVLAETLARLGALGKVCSVLPTQHDIDRPADLRRVRGLFCALDPGLRRDDGVGPG